MKRRTKKSQNLFWPKAKQEKKREKPNKLSKTRPTHLGNKVQAHPEAHGPKQDRRGSSQGTTAPALLPLGPILCLAVPLRGWRTVRGWIQGIFPYNRPNHLLYKEGFTPTFTHHSIHKVSRLGLPSFASYSLVEG
jgi:hypothetical protein